MAADSRCIRTSSALSNPPLTLRDLDQLGLERIKGVGPKTLVALEAFEVRSILDLLETYPRRYIDRTNMAMIADLVEGVPALVVVTVESTSAFTTRNNKKMVKVAVSDGTKRLNITFFNQGWREKQLYKGLEVAVFGKPELFNGSLQMTNPLVDPVGKATGRIVPIYPQSEKVRISSSDLATWIEDALNKCAPRGFADTVPQSLLDQHGFISRNEAMKGIHFPESIEAHQNARRRLAFDEVLRVQLMLVGKKAQWERDSAGFSHETSGHLIDGFMKALPFPLTGAQTRTIGEIYKDLASGTPMHRLLQGDVGSGKTLVAVATMLASVQGGHQAAIMAPTEVLADQHALGIRALLASLTVSDDSNLFGDRTLRIELLTNKVTGEQRRNILAGIADGSVDIAIGTHALIQDSVYGDLDVSVLDELPPGRTPISTAWVHAPLEIESMWGDVRSRLDAGEQAYVVCPLIEESEKLEVASAQETYDQLSVQDLAGYTIGLLHGRMSSADKEAVMNSFRSGATQVLVATTVIEVGVDVPNATCMVVLDANRFGIAQLHQLRGRVGRGKLLSQCYLMTQNGEPSPRIEALVASTDGFVLAEEDLKLRGEGTIMSVNQKGQSDLTLASLQRDLELIQWARNAAVGIIQRDPVLSDLPLLRDELDLLFSDSDEEFLFKS